VRVLVLLLGWVCGRVFLGAWELLLALGILVEPGDTECPTCGAAEGSVCPVSVPHCPDCDASEPKICGAHVSSILVLYHPARERLATWYSARNVISLGVTLALFLGAVLARYL